MNSGVEFSEKYLGLNNTVTDTSVLDDLIILHIYPLKYALKGVESTTLDHKNHIRKGFPPTF